MKWEKYAKIRMKMLGNRLSFADSPVPITLTLFTSEQIQEVSTSKNIYGFPLEQIFLEFFSFTHGEHLGNHVNIYLNIK